MSPHQVPWYVRAAILPISFVFCTSPFAFKIWQCAGCYCFFSISTLVFTVSFHFQAAASLTLLHPLQQGLPLLPTMVEVRGDTHTITCTRLTLRDGKHLFIRTKWFNTSFFVTALDFPRSWSYNGMCLEVSNLLDASPNMYPSGRRTGKVSIVLSWSSGIE